MGCPNQRWNRVDNCAKWFIGSVHLCRPSGVLASHFNAARHVSIEMRAELVFPAKYPVIVGESAAERNGIRLHP